MFGVAVIQYWAKVTNGRQGLFRLTLKSWWQEAEAAGRISSPSGKQRGERWSSAQDPSLGDGAAHSGVFPVQ